MNQRPLPSLLLVLLLTVCPLTSISFAADPPIDPDKLALKIEALMRLKGLDLEANPTLKSAVLKVLDATEGTPQFVELVKAFNLPNQEKRLLQVASSQPDKDIGVEAIRLILAQDKTGPIQQALQSTNHVAAINTAIALGHARNKKTTPLLLPLIKNGSSPLPLRKASVQSLAQTPEGAQAILELARKDQLAPDLKYTATTLLNRVRWPEIRKEAKELLPLPKGPDAKPLPPLSELVKMKGNPANGLKVYQSTTASCSKCHKAKNIGTDVGPNLSEIGTKLGKDAIYEAIFEPSAGISFGFEAWSFELSSGEEAYGILASETADEIAIKDTQGIITRYKKSEVEDRTQMQLSLMPTGLQQAMPLQDLVDLVEFLSTLK